MRLMRRSHFDDGSRADDEPSEYGRTSHLIGSHASHGWLSLGRQLPSHYSLGQPPREI